MNRINSTVSKLTQLGDTVKSKASKNSKMPDLILKIQTLEGENSTLKD